MLKLSHSSICFYCLLSIGLLLAACKEDKPLESPLISVTLYPTPVYVAISSPAPIPTPITPTAQNLTAPPTLAAPTPPAPEMTFPAPYDEISSTATRILKGSTSLLVQNVNHYELGQTSSRVRVIRDNKVIWLTPGPVFRAKFKYPKTIFTFGSFCITKIEDLNPDSEPELIVYCGQGGSGGWGSIHIYSWQRNIYRLIWESVQRNIHYELIGHEGKNDSPRIVVRYFYSPRYDILIEWANVYKLQKGRIIDISSKSPDIYAKLLVRLHQMVAHQKQNLSIQETQAGAVLWIAELNIKIAEAETILVKANKINE